MEKKNEKEGDPRFHLNNSKSNLLRLDDTSEVMSSEGGGGCEGWPPPPSLVRNLFTLRLEP